MVLSTQFTTITRTKGAYCYAQVWRKIRYGRLSLCINLLRLSRLVFLVNVYYTTPKIRWVKPPAAS